LAVLLAAVPLMLPSSSAGMSVHQPGAADHAVSGPEPARILHLRQADLPLAPVHALAAPGDTAEDAMIDVARVATVALPGRGMSTSRVTAAVASRGRSAVPEARTAAIPAQASQKSGVRSGGAPRRLIWPAQGMLTSPFGWRIHPIFGTREFHTGIDIAGQSGAPVLAAYAGTVRFVGWQEGYGKRVVVDSGAGLVTAYSHLSVADVQPQAYVTQGQEIGRIGSTGWSTGPHLLFEVYENGVPQNPAGYLP